MKKTHEQYVNELVQIIRGKGKDLEIENITILKNSVRFYPFWSTEDTNQLTGLINMINFILKNNSNIDNALEIGSHLGESASIFLSFKEIKKIYCIDNWQNAIFYNFFNKKMQKFIDQERCIAIRKKSEEAKDLILKDKIKFDLIYIDGGHSEKDISNDLNIWSNFLNKNGFLCGHDYDDKWKFVKKTVDAFREKESNSFINFKVFCDSSWCLQKI